MNLPLFVFALENTQVILSQLCYTNNYSEIRKIFILARLRDVVIGVPRFLLKAIMLNAKKSVFWHKWRFDVSIYV